MSCLEVLKERGYDKEKLSEKNKAFIEGMEHVMNEVVRDDLIKDEDFSEIKEVSPTLAKIGKEISDFVTQCIQSCIESEIGDVIVSLTEEEDDEK